MPQTVGLIGLGNMGLPVGTCLLRRGFPLVVHDLAPERVAALVAAGAQAVGSPAELAAACVVAITLLPGPAEVERVVLGPEGLLGGARPGWIYVDCSSSDPALSRRLAAALAERGAAMLDAPVSGGVAGATAGTLTAMVGGDPDVLARARAVLAAFAPQQFHVGGHGQGHALKIVNQVLVDVGLAAFCEALLLGSKLGLDPRLVYEVIGASAGNSHVFQRNAPRLWARDFAPRWTVDIAGKDLGLAAAAAAANGVPMPLLATTLVAFRQAQAEGLGAEDALAVIKPLERAAGVEVVAPLDT
ncbi:MAG: NAD(P)-dependent oxidoreductase [Chloroflexota bacterium]